MLFAKVNVATTSTKEEEQKIKVAEAKVIVKFQSLQVNKGMVDALIIQLQNGKEKFGGVFMAFDEVNIATITAEETMATKFVDKMRLIKYGKSLQKGN
jgi:hypothetical protein